MLNTTQHNNLDKPLGLLANSLKLAALCVLLNVIPAPASLASGSTPSVTLAWDASTGTNVAGYKVYYGTASRTYTQVVPAGDVTQTTIGSLTVGATYYFAATASDSTGLESTYSNETSFTLPAPRPQLVLLRNGSRSVLEWPTNCPGYTLQSSSGLAGGWTNLTSNPSNSAGCFTYTNTVAAAARYYRLKK